MNFLRAIKIVRPNNIDKQLADKPSLLTEEHSTDTAEASTMYPHKKKKGSVLAETGASLVILIPLAVLLVFVISETSYCYYAKSILAQAARQSARDLAIAYGKDPTIALATARPQQELISFDNIRLANIVTSSDQFANPVWQTGVVPHTVTETVSLHLPNMPLLPGPDPLGLGSSYNITASATYRLE